MPQPACGFVCGAGGACPDDYTCNSANRCQLNGSTVSPSQCLGVDAGIDMMDSIGVDVPDGNNAPTVTTVSPADMATGVGVGATVTAAFSEQVTGVSTSTFTLNQGGQPISGTVVDNGGLSATFTPAAQLAPSTTYTATLTNSITDLQGAPLVQKSWTFTTGTDSVAPMVTSRTPAPNATGVAVSSVVTAQFDEPVIGVSGTTFTLAAGATAIAGTVTYTAGTRTATFTPTAALPAGTLLTATLTSGITDTSSNALSAAPVTWTFTTAADTTAPTVQTRTPAPAATMVATTTTIVVTFDEPVMNVTTTTFTVNDGAAVAGTLASAMSGRQWTFTPTAPLANAATVTVTLTAAITDLAGNALSAAPVIWTFTTAADTTAPAVMTRTPASGATMVATNTTIVVLFTEPVMNVTTTSFTVTDGTAVAGTLASSMSGRQWTFTPLGPLTEGATVTVTLSTAITDLAGNGLAAPVSWMFTTVPDVTAPTVMTRTPTPNTTLVPVTTTINVTFNEPVMNVTAATFTVNDGAAVTGTLTSAVNARQWTFTPSAPLANNASVTVTLTTGITDLAGNALAAPVMWGFMTAPDTTAPTVQSIVPANNATAVSTGTTVVVTFSEPVMGVTTSSFVVSAGPSTTGGTVASSNGGRTWTFTPTAALPAATMISVALMTSITDLAGNPLATQFNSSFTTQ